jgi:hypothetical protein
MHILRFAVHIIRVTNLSRIAVGHYFPYATVQFILVTDILLTSGTKDIQKDAGTVACSGILTRYFPEETGEKRLKKTGVAQVQFKPGTSQT